MIEQWISHGWTLHFGFRLVGLGLFGGGVVIDDGGGGGCYSSGLLMWVHGGGSGSGSGGKRVMGMVVA